MRFFGKGKCKFIANFRATSPYEVYQGADMIVLNNPFPFNARKVIARLCQPIHVKAKHGYLPRSALEPFEPVRPRPSFRRPKLPNGWVWDLFLLSFRTFLLTRNLYVTETLFYTPASDVLHVQTLVHAHTCTDTHTHTRTRARARARTHTHSILQTIMKLLASIIHLMFY